MASEPNRPPQQPSAWPSASPGWPDLPPPDPMDPLTEPQGTHSVSGPGHAPDSSFAMAHRGDGSPSRFFREPFPGAETTVGHGPAADRPPGDAAPGPNALRHGGRPDGPHEARQEAWPEAPRHEAPRYEEPQQDVPRPEGPRHGASGPVEDPYRSADDRYRPFVTAGQISGPKTPPPERQQELWNNVFSDHYEAIGDEADLPEEGRPVWLFALVGSAAVALALVLVWAFVAGPLATDEKATAAAAPQATATPSPKVTTKPQSIGRLPKYSGTPSPVQGRLTDQTAAITLPRLGGPWRLDLRTEHIRSTYGFTTRQYVAAGTDPTGRPRFAMIMSGPLSERLASRYTSPDTLGPVINAVAVVARRNYFPQGNRAVKTAQQRLTVNGMPGQLNAYEITAGEQKTTMVVAAVSTGADLPAIVYMQVPDSRRNLLPDINTVFRSIRLLNP